VSIDSGSKSCAELLTSNGSFFSIAVPQRQWAGNRETVDWNSGVNDGIHLSDIPTTRQLRMLPTSQKATSGALQGLLRLAIYRQLERLDGGEATVIATSFITQCVQRVQARCAMGWNETCGYSHQDKEEA
jgi:hypothetical protein